MGHSLSRNRQHEVPARPLLPRSCQRRCSAPHLLRPASDLLPRPPHHLLLLPHWPHRPPYHHLLHQPDWPHRPPPDLLLRTPHQDNHSHLLLRPSPWLRRQDPRLHPHRPSARRPRVRLPPHQPHPRRRNRIRTSPLSNERHKNLTPVIRTSRLANEPHENHPGEKAKEGS